MAINRYVDVDFDQPVSNYVPLPLEMLYKLGKDASKDYEDTISGIQSAKGLLSKHKTQTSVKIYDPNVPGGVRDAAIDFEPQRQAYQERLSKEMESITNDYTKDKDNSKFKQRMAALKNDAIAMDNDLATKSALVEKIEKHKEEIAKNQDMSLTPYLRNQELAYNTSIYNDLAQGKANYDSYNVAKPTDRPKEIKETFDSLGEEILESFASATGDGYIRNKYREGRTKEKINSVFQPWYENSSTKQDIKLEANDFFARKGIDPEGIYDTIKDDKGNEIKITNFDHFESNKIAELAQVARGYKTSKGKDDLNADTTWQYQDKKKKEEISKAALTGTTIESNTFNLANLDPEYKSLKDSNILQESDNGLISVKWSRGITEKKLKTFNLPGSPFPIIMLDDRDAMSSDQMTKLVKQMDKMARATGWYNINNKLESKDFDKIASAYNIMSKSRLSGEKINPVIAELKTKEIDRNYENYQAYNPEDIDSPSATKPALFKDGEKGELSIQNRLTNSNGNSIITGTIKYKDGTSAPVALRSNSKQEDMYFGDIASIGSKSAKYIIGAEQRIGMRTINGTAYDVIEQKVLPESEYKVTVIANPSSKMQQKYIVEVPKHKVDASMVNLTTAPNGNKVVSFDSYAEAQLFLNNSWYTATSYGSSEISELESNQKKSENYK